MKLLIVESPHKVKTVAKALGKDYKVMASVGHIIDLPKSKLGVDVEHDFAPQYQNIKSKAQLIKELCAEGKTILVSSHILSELSQMCTDIGIIDAGKIVLSGNMAEILQKVNDSNPLLIRICGESRTAIGILKKDPRVQTIAIRDEDIIVNFHGNRQAEAELLYSLMEAGIPVSGFIREQGDLESIFMQITSHDKGKVVLSSEE